MMNRILISILLVLILSIFSKDNIVYAAENKKAPGFSLADTNGKLVKLSDFKGKIVIIDFFATWCGPCRKGIPDLIDLQKEFGKKIVVIGISLDQQKNEVAPFIKKMGINYPVVFGTPEVAELYGGVDAIPHSFIIDKKGKIVDQHVGLVPKSDYSALLKKLLKKT